MNGFMYATIIHLDSEGDNGMISMKDLPDNASPNGAIPFGLALEALRMGRKVKRMSWGGSRFLVQREKTIFITNLREGDEEDAFPWFASGDDLVSGDWMIL